MLWWLARRFTRSAEKSQGFLRYARLLSVSGIAIGTAGLLIALSVVHGFKEVISAKILDFGAPVTVSTYSTDPLYRADTLKNWLGNQAEVAGAYAILESQVVLQHRQAVQGAIMQAMEPADPSIQLKKYLSAGEWLDAGGIVLGKRMAEKLQVDVGDRITIYAITEQQSAFQSPKVLQLPLIGIYHTGVDRFDDSLCILPLQDGRDLLGTPSEQANRMHLVPADKFKKIEDFDAWLQEWLAFPYFTETIYERFSDLFSWIRLQEQIIPPIIGVMIIVAAFNLIGAILMFVLEKTRNIGMLITMGMPRKQVQRLFILQAIWLSFQGWLAGIMIFSLFHFTQLHFQWIPLDEVNYFMEYAPTSPQLSDILIVSGVTLLLAILAGWIPSREAASTNVIRILRFSQA